jgi:hypothetical protein
MVKLCLRVVVWKEFLEVVIETQLAQGCKKEKGKQYGEAQGNPGPGLCWYCFDAME